MGLINLAEVFAVDVYFLDALYHLTHHVDVTTAQPTDQCGSCGRRFYPVL